MNKTNDTLLAKTNEEIYKTALKLNLVEISSDGSNDLEDCSDDEMEDFEDEVKSSGSIKIPKAVKEFLAFKSLLSDSDQISAHWNGNLALAGTPVFSKQELSDRGFNWDFNLKTQILTITFWASRKSYRRRTKLAEFSYHVKVNFDQIFGEVFRSYFMAELWDHSYDVLRKSEQEQRQKETLSILENLFD